MMEHMRILLLSFFLLCQIPLWAQVAPSSTEEMMRGIDQRAEMRKTSILNQYPARSIGPVIQGARIVDIAVKEVNTKEFYIAYASGGVFYTHNNGISFEPIFDNQGALTIGDIALAPSNNDVIYVGTGENNSSRSSYAGSGIYKSADAGKTWEHLGLDGTQHIGRIIVHPENPDIVWVAAMGGLYSDNPDRGVYKSTDGGKSWSKTLFVDDKTGAIDLIIDPSNPDKLWASMWERKRAAWDFVGNGPGSGIYMSEDGGENWKLSMKGIPDDEFAGRIGLDISLSDPNILYAVMDYQKETKTKKEKEEEDKLVVADFVKMNKKEFMKLDNEQLDEFLNNSGYPRKYSAEKVKNEIEAGKYEPKALAEYFGDANNALFDTEVAGSVVYKSTDGGATWSQTYDYALEAVFYTYGYYFGEIRIGTETPDNIYVLGVPLVVSRDGGKTFQRTDTIGDVHSDHQSMWINPEDEEHIILGNDGGLYISYDGGASWDHKNNMSVGQFYTVNVDMEKPYNVYGGLQDNGTLVGSSRTVPNERGQWEPLFGGDGMYVSADPRNNDIVYVGFQFGNYYRINRETGDRAYITPSHDIGEAPHRFNWRTPVLMSSHNADIIYMGSYKVHRSLDQGNNWEDISADLTKGGKEGNVPFGTITEIAESPLRFGLLYVGTDDGNIWLSKGGDSWTDISKGLPSDLWVSSIHASNHDEATVYVSLTGYRFDNFETYIYKSTDYGKTWKSLEDHLPHEAVNVIYQDPEVASLLYLGTDHGTYVSFDDGGNWQHLNAIPNVASYDMIVHPRDLELVVGTHGRSVYIVDVKPLQEVARKGVNTKVLAFGVDNIRHSDRWGEKRAPYTNPYLPEISIPYYLGSNSTASISILDKEGNEVVALTGAGKKGFHEITWNVKTASGDFAGKGKYAVKITSGGETAETSFEIK